METRKANGQSPCVSCGAPAECDSMLCAACTAQAVSYEQQKERDLLRYLEEQLGMRSSAAPRPRREASFFSRHARRKP